MHMKKINLSLQFISPRGISIAVFVLLVAVVVWQGILIGRKNQAIDALAIENNDLKKNLFALDGELSQIKDTASDVRVFQRELIKVIKDIDQRYPLNIAHKIDEKPSCGFDESVDIDAGVLMKNAHQNVFTLASSQSKLRFETAGLLGRAISIRNVLEGTPSLQPVHGEISSDYGIRVDPITGKIKNHSGLDFAAKIGTPVYATADGVVIRATRTEELGNVIELRHADGYTSIYGHLSEMSVKRNNVVKRRQQIGRVGNTGTRCAGAHLHFGISKNGVRQNPKPFLLSAPPVFF